MLGCFLIPPATSWDCFAGLDKDLTILSRYDIKVNRFVLYESFLLTNPHETTSIGSKKVY